MSNISARRINARKTSDNEYGKNASMSAVFADMVLHGLAGQAVPRTARPAPRAKAAARAWGERGAAAGPHSCSGMFRCCTTLRTLVTLRLMLTENSSFGR